MIFLIFFLIFDFLICLQVNQNSSKPRFDCWPILPCWGFPVARDLFLLENQIKPKTRRHKLQEEKKKAVLFIRIIKLPPFFNTINNLSSHLICVFFLILFNYSLHLIKSTLCSAIYFCNSTQKIQFPRHPANHARPKYCPPQGWGRIRLQRRRQSQIPSGAPRYGER